MRSSIPQRATVALALLLAFGMTAPAQAHRSRPQIEGPSTQLEATAFELCAPSAKKSTYEWSGPGIVGSSTRSCVDVSGLAPGTHTFTLVVTPKGSRSKGTTYTHEVSVISEAQACDITGPSRIEPCSDLELCGPDFEDVKYYWRGPGIHEKRTRRCIDVRGLEPGAHLFTLEIGGLGAPVSCEFTVEVGEPENCLIEGPSRVARDESFELCGPDGAGYSWTWEGKHIPAGTTSRCVTVSGLPPGRYEYTLELGFEDAVEVCSWDVVVVDSSATCFVGGPSTVEPGTPFELCGPSDALAYEWDGAGVLKGADSPCITVEGLKPGRYTYELTVSRATGDETCSFRVKVREPLLPALCPQPLDFWQQECGRLTRRLGFVSEADLARIAACVDDRSAAFDWTDDVAGFNQLLDGRGPKGVSRKLSKQYAVLLANVCAAEFDLLNARGDSIGLDPATMVSYGKDEWTIGELIETVEAALLGTPPDSKKESREITRLIASVSYVNSGKGDEFACGVDRRGRGGDKKDDLRARQGAGDEGGVGSIAPRLDRPSPNPFTATTRIQYEIPQGGALAEIAVYDLAGRMIRRLANGRWEAGIHEVAWDGTNSEGTKVRAGVYFLRGRVGEQPTQWRLMYMK